MVRHPKHVAECQRIVFPLLPLSYVRHGKSLKYPKEKASQRKKASAMKSIAQFPSAVRGAAALMWEQRPAVLKLWLIVEQFQWKWTNSFSLWAWRFKLELRYLLTFISLRTAKRARPKIVLINWSWKSWLNKKTSKWNKAMQEYIFLWMRNKNIFHK